MLINPHPPGRHGEESITVIVQMPLNLAYIAAAAESKESVAEQAEQASPEAAPKQP